MITLKILCEVSKHTPPAQRNKKAIIFLPQVVILYSHPFFMLLLEVVGSCNWRQSDLNLQVPDSWKVGAQGHARETHRVARGVCIGCVACMAAAEWGCDNAGTLREGGRIFPQR